MDHQDGTNIAALHTSIASTSALAFPGVHFEFYREDRDKLPAMGELGQPTACCMLELTELDPVDADPGTEQVDVIARFEAQFVIGFRTPSAKVAIRALAGSYAAYLRKRSRWPDVVNGHMQNIRCFKDDFSPELDQYEIWTVEWTQVLRLGEGVWKETGITPGMPLFSYAPLIGNGNADEYVPLDAFKWGIGDD